MNDKLYEAQKQYDNQLPDDIEEQLLEEQRREAYLEWMEQKGEDERMESMRATGRIGSDIDRALERYIEE